MKAKHFSLHEVIGGNKPDEVHEYVVASSFDEAIEIFKAKHKTISPNTINILAVDINMPDYLQDVSCLSHTDTVIAASSNAFNNGSATHDLYSESLYIKGATFGWLYAKNQIAMENNG